MLLESIMACDDHFTPMKLLTGRNKSDDRIKRKTENAVRIVMKCSSYGEETLLVQTVEPTKK